MGRSKSPLSGGEEKTCGGGGGGGGVLSLLFPPAHGDFLIDFQGYVSNLFFRLGALWMRERVNVFQAISSNSAWLGMFCIRPPPPPPPPFSSPLLLFPCSFFLVLSLIRKKEVTLTQKSIHFQTGCLRWQHRSLAAIKTFALLDRLFLFWTLYAVEWITGAP